MFTRRQFLASSSSLIATPAWTPAWTQTSLPKPGCQANAWDLDPQRFDLLLTALREIKELGFQGFETNIRFVQPQLPRLDSAKAQIAATGLTFIAAHTGLPDYSHAGSENALAAISQLAADAQKFGAQALVVSHSGLSKTGEFERADLEKKARLLDLAGERCRDAGIQLAYHNHQPEFRHNAAEETGLLELTHSKLVSLMFDIGHAWLAYPQAVDFFTKYQDRVFGLHVRDFHNGESVPLGQGEFPLRALAAAIRATGWHGWLIDEEERPNLARKPGKAVTGPSRKAMREIFGV